MFTNVVKNKNPKAASGAIWSKGKKTSKSMKRSNNNKVAKAFFTGILENLLCRKELKKAFNKAKEKVFCNKKRLS